MRKQQTSDYVELGLNVRYLMTVWAGSHVHDRAGVVATLDDAYRLLDQLGFVVTRRLGTFVGLDQLHERLAATEPDAKLSEDDAKRLREMASQMRQTLMAESRGLFAYVTGNKRLDVAKLLEDPAALFPAGEFAKLSEMAQTDVGEAFKCIALERATAAAFHLMRAVEESLRRLYLTGIGDRTPAKKPMWHGMTEDLRKSSSAPPDELLAQLDHIRRSFRNPTQHPEAIYDIDDAQDLAFLSIDVLTRLVRAMPSE
jgi:hypothetical protein